MTPTENGWNTDAWDALLFDYLEGNLPQSQVKELEDKLATDQALRAQLELWKEAFVVQNFYPTTQLEESLLKPEVSTVGSSTAYIVLLCLISSFFSFLPLTLDKPGKENMPTGASTNINPEAYEIKTTITTDRQIPVPEHILVEKTPYTIAQKQTKAVLNQEVASKKLFIHGQITNLHLPPLQLSNPIPEVTIGEIRGRKAAKPIVKRTKTRKERRAIEQMKERALQRRMANEFLKGRIPYVVPLNIKNF